MPYVTVGKKTPVTSIFTTMTGAADNLPWSKIVKGATLKIYPGAPHGMCTTLKQQVNEELLAFFKA